LFGRLFLSDARAVVQQNIWTLLREKARGAANVMVNQFMEAERTEWLGLGPYQRGKDRRGLRNGYYERNLDTKYGPLKLRVPRTRCSGFRSLVFDAYVRRQQELNRSILRWVARGMSTREIIRSVREEFRAAVSPTTVSNVIGRLDGEIRAFHTRSLEHGYRYLWLDGKHWYTSRPRKRRGRGKKRKRVLLVAWGMRADGAEELVDFRVAPGETEEDWTAFLTDLEARGVKPRKTFRGQSLEMIATDGHAAIEAAKLMVYPKVPHQRCIFHKIRNIAQHLRERTNRKAILRDATRVHRALRTRQEALRRLDEWSAEWAESEPEAVRAFRQDFEWTLVYLNAPSKHRRRLRTTNPAERVMRELARKIKEVGIFPSDVSWERTTYLTWLKLKTGGYAPTIAKHPARLFTQRS